MSQRFRAELLYNLNGSRRRRGEPEQRLTSSQETRIRRGLLRGFRGPNIELQLEPRYHYCWGCTRKGGGN
jgi:hypothetical protein